MYCKLNHSLRYYILPYALGHNRFHYKCCDKDTGISLEDVKQQSLKNAEKIRDKKRLNSRLNSTSSVSDNDLTSSLTTKQLDLESSVSKGGTKTSKLLAISDAKATALQVTPYVTVSPV